MRPITHPSSTSFKVLSHIRINPRLTSKQVAEALGLTQGAVSGAVSTLYRKGCINRYGHSTTGYTYEVTPEGRKIVESRGQALPNTDSEPKKKVTIQPGTIKYRILQFLYDAKRFVPYKNISRHLSVKVSTYLRALYGHGLVERQHHKEPGMRSGYKYAITSLGMKFIEGKTREEMLSTRKLGTSRSHPFNGKRQFQVEWVMRKRGLDRERLGRALGRHKSFITSCYNNKMISHDAWMLLEANYGSDLNDAARDYERLRLEAKKAEEERKEEDRKEEGRKVREEEEAQQEEFSKGDLYRIVDGKWTKVNLRITDTSKLMETMGAFINKSAGLDGRVESVETIVCSIESLLKDLNVKVDAIIKEWGLEIPKDANETEHGS